MGVQIPKGKGQFWGREEAAHCKAYGLPVMTCAKMAEPLEMLFGLWTRVGRRKHVLDGGARWCHLVIIIDWTNRMWWQCAFFVKLLRALVIRLTLWRMKENNGPWSEGFCVVNCRPLIWFWLEWKMLNLISMKLLLCLELRRYYV